MINPERGIGALSLEDFSGAIAGILAAAPKLKRFDVFNLQSYWGTEDAIASEIAYNTGIIRSAMNYVPGQTSVKGGGSVSTKRFTAATGFAFKGKSSTIIKNLLDHLSSLCAGTPAQARDVPPCVICGSHDMMPVLDLNLEPLANDFNNTTAALSCETYPPSYCSVSPLPTHTAHLFCGPRSPLL